jgi:hypothetical protein
MSLMSLMYELEYRLKETEEHQYDLNVTFSLKFYF